MRWECKHVRSPADNANFCDERRLVCFSTAIFNAGNIFWVLFSTLWIRSSCRKVMLWLSLPLGRISWGADELQRTRAGHAEGYGCIWVPRIDKICHSSIVDLGWESCSNGLGAGAESVHGSEIWQTTTSSSERRGTCAALISKDIFYFFNRKSWRRARTRLADQVRILPYAECATVRNWQKIRPNHKNENRNENIYR